MSKFWEWQRELLKCESPAIIMWALRLAAYASDGESIWVSAERVAGDYGATKEAVRTGRKRVIRAGWLTPTGRQRNGQSELTISVGGGSPCHASVTPWPTIYKDT